MNQLIQEAQLPNPEMGLAVFRMGTVDVSDPEVEAWRKLAQTESDNELAARNSETSINPVVGRDTEDLALSSGEFPSTIERVGDRGIITRLSDWVRYRIASEQTATSTDRDKGGMRAGLAVGVGAIATVLLAAGFRSNDHKADASSIAVVPRITEEECEQRGPGWEWVSDDLGCQYIGGPSSTTKKSTTTTVSTTRKTTTVPKNTNPGSSQTTTGTVPAEQPKTIVLWTGPTPDSVYIFLDCTNPLYDEACDFFAAHVPQV